MKKKNLKFYSLLSFFSVLIVRRRFFFYKETRCIFLDQNLKNIKKNWYDTYSSKQIVSFWRGRTQSWKVEAFVDKTLQNLSCCFSEKKFVIGLQKKNLNEIRFTRTLNFLFSSNPNSRFKGFPLFKIVDCLLDIRFSRLKIPINSSGVCWSFLNSTEEQIHVHKKTEILEEISLFKDKTNHRKNFSGKNSDFSIFNFFEKFYLFGFIITKYTFFSKIFQFLSSF